MTSGPHATTLAGCLALACALAAPGAAGAQQGQTQGLTQQLTSLLDQRKLDSVAARDPSDTNSFVAALYFPGAQLLVVGAKYTAPELLNEKILQRNYRDVYIDLNAASDPASKVLVEDLQADGLRARRNDDQPFDSVTRGVGDRFPFDGDWRKRRVSEDEYFRTFSDAETKYSHMLEVLIGELKKTDAQ
jgi:hypothetical protein